MKKNKHFSILTPENEWQAKLVTYQKFIANLLKNNSATIGGLIILLFIITVIVAPLIAPYSPYEQLLELSFAKPQWSHIFGTDNLGRDILSRIIYGTRSSLWIVATVLIISAPLGTILGVIAGYRGGILDTILMRFTDIFSALPKLILALAFVVALGPGLKNAILSIALVGWTSYTRLVRAESLRIRSYNYIKAAITQGSSNVRIIFCHMLPICLPAIVVRMSLDMSGIILSVAGLGFLGLGAQPPLPEWGSMLAAGRDHLFEHWWIVTFPGLAIFFLSLGFNLFSSGLRDILDPKQL